MESTIYDKAFSVLDSTPSQIDYIFCFEQK